MKKTNWTEEEKTISRRSYNSGIRLGLLIGVIITLISITAIGIHSTNYAYNKGIHDYRSGNANYRVECLSNKCDTTYITKNLRNDK